MGQVLYLHAQPIANLYIYVSLPRDWISYRPLADHYLWKYSCIATYIVLGGKINTELTGNMKDEVWELYANTSSLHTPLEHLLTGCLTASWHQLLQWLWRIMALLGCTVPERRICWMLCSPAGKPALVSGTVLLLTSVSVLLSSESFILGSLTPLESPLFSPWPLLVLGHRLST